MIKLSVWKNRLMGIIFYMTIFQLIYDVELLPFCSSDVTSMAFVSCRTSAIGVGIMTGMASASCTCVISALVAYVILTRKRTGISPVWMFAIIVVPSLSLGLAEGIQYYKLTTNTIHSTNLDKIEEQKKMFEVLLNVYDYYRLAQVVFNTVCVGAIFCILYSINIICVRENQMHSSPLDPSNENPQDSMKSKSSSQRGGANTAYPMFLLAMRLIWYPIAQSVARFGASWYQFSYGSTITSYPSTLVTTDSPGLLSLRLWVYVFLTPSAGLAYFLIFLRMQSGAMREFRKPFLYLYDLTSCAKSNQLEDEKDDTDIGSRAATAGNQSTSTNKSLGLSLGDRTRKSAASEGNASNKTSNSYTYAEDTVRSESDGSLYETDDDVTEMFATTDAGSDLGKPPGDVESGYTGGQSETGFDVLGSGAAMGDRMQTAVLSNGAPPNPSSAAHQPRTSSKNDERVVIGALNENNLRKIAKGDAKNAAQNRLAKMRKRTSLRSQSATEVSNIEAIVDSEGDIDREVLNQLDEDELFDLIALQETRSVSSRGRQGGGYQIDLGPMRSAESTTANHTTANSEKNSMTDSIISGGSLSFRSRSPSGSQSIGMNSSTVSNPLRNTAIAVSDNAGPSGSIGGRFSTGRSASTAPVDISSVHPSRDSTIEEGDEMAVSPAAKNNRFSQV